MENNKWFPALTLCISYTETTTCKLIKLLNPILRSQLDLLYSDQLDTLPESLLNNVLASALFTTTRATIIPMQLPKNHSPLPWYAYRTTQAPCVDTYHYMGSRRFVYLHWDSLWRICENPVDCGCQLTSLRAWVSCSHSGYHQSISGRVKLEEALFSKVLWVETIYENFVLNINYLSYNKTL